MAITNSKEKFCHELGDIYNAEHQIVSGLQQMIPQTTDENLKSLLQQHLDQTQQQIKRLEQAWEQLGQQPQQVTCDGMSGILAEGKKTMQEAQAPSLRDGVIGGGADKVEHYEISSYQNLIIGAGLMGQNQVSDLLKQNLKEEQWMAQHLEESAPKLAEKAMATSGPAPQGTTSEHTYTAT